MATSTKELYEQALTLDENDRAALANLILESLEASDPDAEQAGPKRSSVELRNSIRVPSGRSLGQMYVQTSQPN